MIGKPECARALFFLLKPRQLAAGARQREPKKLNIVEKTRMIFSNRLDMELGQRDFESIEGAAKAEICEEEGL
jgi:hypothetical protein